MPDILLQLTCVCCQPQNPATGCVWHNKLYMGYMENRYGFRPIRDPGALVPQVLKHLYIVIDTRLCPRVHSAQADQGPDCCCMQHRNGTCPRSSCRTALCLEASPTWRAGRMCCPVMWPRIWWNLWLALPFSPKRSQVAAHARLHAAALLHHLAVTLCDVKPPAKSCTLQCIHCWLQLGCQHCNGRMS